MNYGKNNGKNLFNPLVKRKLKLPIKKCIFYFKLPIKKCINYIGGDVSVIYNADGGTLEKNEEVIYGKKSAYINNNWEKEDCLNGWRLDTYTLDIYKYNASITLSPIYEQISNTN